MSDRPLDTEIALRALREQFPDQVFAQVEALPEGWATDPYLVDEHFVARFPRNAEMAEWIDWDESVLSLAKAHLGSRMAVPQVLGRGSAGEHFPHAFLVTGFIEGVPCDATSTPPPESLAKDLGAALTSIHSVPVGSAAEVGVTQPDWDDYDGELFFLHGDFSPPNIIMDPSTGRLAGIIDWGNAVLGDRARDFHKLVLDLGWGFTRRVLDCYRLPVDERFLVRLRHYSQVEATQWFLDSARRRLDLERNRKWVRNAFSVDGAF